VLRLLVRSNKFTFSPAYEILNGPSSFTLLSVSIMFLCCFHCSFSAKWQRHHFVQLVKEEHRFNLSPMLQMLWHFGSLWNVHVVNINHLWLQTFSSLAFNSQFSCKSICLLHLRLTTVTSTQTSSCSILMTFKLASREGANQLRWQERKSCKKGTLVWKWFKRYCRAETT